MTLDYLKNKIKNLPQESGVYMFSASGGKILYIGKAANLKNRVSSYLKTEDIRIQKMLSLAKSIKYIATDSDIEALILESQYIKKHQPPFNIMLRDDKQYFYVGFSNDYFPKLIITHQPPKIRNSNIETRNKFKIKNSKFKTVSDFGFRASDLNSASAEFMGPFTDGNALKITLRFLRSVFPYCTCKQLHNNFCLNYHIGKCFGFCCLKKPIADKPLWITDLRSRLSTDSQIMTYQKNIKALKDILSGKKVSLIKDLKKEMALLAKRGDLEKAIELQNKARKLERIFENARIIKDSDILKIHRSGLESLLKLQKPIIRIEGYDISNIQGVHATGSMVVFTNGIPDKNQYRKFKIRNSNIETRNKFRIQNLKFKTFSDFGFRASDFHSGGDTAMLKEILERRFKHPEWPFPDLILIDGGKQQLRVAEAVVNSKQIPIIAVTKNKKHIGEKIYISGKKSPLSLTKLSPTFKNLLLQIDSEAHRFAISYYRKLHRKLFR